jgi:hypothetical protein
VLAGVAEPQVSPRARPFLSANMLAYIVLLVAGLLSQAFALPQQLDSTTSTTLTSAP